ncbi:lysophospholipase, putative [Babesia ovis]|uniref:Lysophospholipase, putative n=1 Tax=Babesia ovis TaxID=5869 RepID=A0A9W5TD46_BABOV|nr:lysophospholipase, putative [Babesia ovis]
MDGKQPSPTFSMSHFTNKQNLLIRTYSARIPDAKASIVLVHGNRCHFRSEFAAYNMKWHMENLGIGTPSVQDVIDRELRAVYPLGASVKSKDPNASFPDYSCLDGRNMFDISPRFIYEGSFIEKLNQLGYNVYGLDHQSNGLSQSLKDRRNFFLSLEDLVDDVIQFIDIVRRGKFDDTKQTMADHKPDSPSTIGTLVLCGASMGGNIVLRAAEKTSVYNKDGRMFFDALITFAPMTDLSSYLTTFTRRALLHLSKVISVVRPESTLGLHPIPFTLNNANATVLRLACLKPPIS